MYACKARRKRQRRKPRNFCSTCPVIEMNCSSTIVSVAFDPAWTELTTEQLELLDEWVAEKAGGLIVVAGPVNTSTWSRGRHAAADDEKIAIVKNLYPVTFYRSGAATIQLGRAGSDQAWPLEFTEEGLRAPFLWLEDSPTGSENVLE